MAISRRIVTKADFEAFISLPENSETIFEYIGGEIVEVPSNPFVSKIAGLILIAIGIFLRENDIGHVTGEGGGYIINGDVYAPDVAFISYDRQPELATDGFNPNPPELAVEVISDPSNGSEQATLRVKTSNYLAAGILVWIVNPHDRYIEVHNGKTVQIFRDGDTLSGGDVLEGFTLPVSDIFPKAKNEQEKE